MEYCQGGSLADLKQGYHPNTWSVTLSERYLWFLLDMFTRSGMLMERGPSPDGNPLWNMIIHGDMRLDNILLGDNPGAYYTDFLLPKIADFGVALIKPAGGDVPNNAWNDFGPEGARAPEQVKSNHFLTPAEKLIAGKTYTPDSPAIVWGVGFLLYSLLVNSPEALNSDDDAWTDAGTPNAPNGLWPDYFDDDGDPLGDPYSPFLANDFDPIIIGRYSTALRQLIRDCLEVNPQNRPTLDQVRATINTYMATDQTLAFCAVNPSQNTVVDQDGNIIFQWNLQNEAPANAPAWRYTLDMVCNLTTLPGVTVGPAPGTDIPDVLPLGGVTGGMM